MASPNNPKSREQLIREHSKARVIVANKPKPVGYATTGAGDILFDSNGMPVLDWNLPLSDESAVELVVKSVK